MSLNNSQTIIYDSILNFLEQNEKDTFILKGYAGTGKTFLMQYLAEELTKKKKRFSFLATTGRAASVLKGKTGFDARTIHSELYSFNKVDGGHLKYGIGARYGIDIEQGKKLIKIFNRDDFT